MIACVIITIQAIGIVYLVMIVHKCPVCNKGMLLLTSMNKKICVDCRKEYPWHLGKDQKPLIQHQR